MTHAIASTRAIHRPKWSIVALLRIAVGFIWLAGAAWNAFVTWHMTDAYGWLAKDAGLTPWRWFFSEVVEKQPGIWTALLIAGEITLGVLTLGRGHWVRLGLLGGALFSISLLSFGTPYTLMMGPYALLLIWIARHYAYHRVRHPLSGH